MVPEAFLNVEGFRVRESERRAKGKKISIETSRRCP